MKNEMILSLLSAAAIATSVRLMIYIFNSKTEDGMYLRDAVTQMGSIVVILEILIVMSRSITILQILEFAKTKVKISNKYELLIMITVGLCLSLAYTFPSRIFDSRLETDNVAIQYISNRPFEPLPLVVEIFVYYLIKSNLANYSMLSIACFSVMVTIVGIYEVKDRRLPEWS